MSRLDLALLRAEYAAKLAAFALLLAVLIPEVVATWPR